MSDSPAISVIIPTFDRPTMLLEAVASALSQQLPPAEVLVMDNGVKAINPATLPAGVRYYRLPPRVGPSVARNEGARLATSEWLAFLDDDDLWDPAYLSSVMSAMKRDNARCVYGRKCLITDHGPIPYKLPTMETLTIPVLLRRNPGTAPINVVLARDLFFKVGGFDENLLVSEDRALALELVRSGERITIAPEAWALVREHDEGHLRLRQGRKLRFLWKYRGLHTPVSFALELLRILAKIVLAALPGGQRLLFMLSMDNSRQAVANRAEGAAR